MARQTKRDRTIPVPTVPIPEAPTHNRLSPKLVVLAKAPIGPGSGARIAKELGVPLASLAYRRVMERTLRHLAGGNLSFTVVAAPGSRDFLSAAQRAGAPTRDQPRGTMGRRMAALMRHAKGPCVIVNSDVPALDAILVRHASAALGLYDLVVGPTWNGGYYLIGLRSPGHAFKLFDRVRWWTPHVLEDTLAHVPQHWKVGLLPVLADVDDAAGLAAAAEDHVPPRWRSSSLGMISMKLHGR